jgi:hypothetical protein
MPENCTRLSVGRQERLASPADRFGGWCFSLGPRKL